MDSARACASGAPCRTSALEQHLDDGHHVVGALPERRQVEVEDLEPDTGVLPELAVRDRHRRSRLVAAITRTSMGMGPLLPNRRTCRSCSTRNRRLWSVNAMSPTSSRKMVPVCAASKSPGRPALRAGERLPRGRRLGLEERVQERRERINRDERMVAAPAALWILREQLLPCRSLRDEHRCVRPGVVLRELLHAGDRPRPADDAGQHGVPRTKRRGRCSDRRLGPRAGSRRIRST